jgi:hypothetical protein
MHDIFLYWLICNNVEINPSDSAEDDKSFQKAETRHGGHAHSLPAHVRILGWVIVFYRY